MAMMLYLFRALEKCELYAYTDELWNIWEQMTKDHLTTCAEDLVRGRSDCHAWGALALYELPSVILGVRPDKPGYEEILVAPQAGKFEWASGNVATIKGNVTVAWKRSADGGIHVKAEGPEGVPLTVLC